MEKAITRATGKISVVLLSLTLLAPSYVFPPAARAAGNVLYVNAAAASGGDGSSWATAFTSIQAAINAAAPGTQLWIESGSYHETSQQLGINIALADGVSLYGGFAGNETALSQRNWTANPTILVGDTYSIIAQLPASAYVTTVISGFTFQGYLPIKLLGNVSPYVTISDNVFQFQYQFALAAQGGSFQGTIEQNTFVLNPNTFFTTQGAVAFGSSGNFQFLNNIVTTNGSAPLSVGVSAGGNTGPQAVIANNLFQGVATAVQLSASPLVANNTIVGAATVGIWNNSNSAPTLVNNIVAFNAGIGIQDTSGSTPEHNNLVYQNGTNYQGLSAGTGDINANPMFVNNASNFQLQANSPAINAGDNSVVQSGWMDLAGNPRIYNGGTVDIGAYEYQGAGTVSAPTITGQPMSQSAVPGETVTFRVSATGNSLSYQWYENGNAIAGANQSSYTLTATLADSGSQWTCTVSNGVGTVTSNAANLAVIAPGSSLSSARVFPNPWRSDKHTGVNISFGGLTLNSTVKIFTVSGHEVKSLDGSSGLATWDLTNDSGSKVASGIYIYLITNSQGDQTRGKLAIIK
jgi:hypothetical protein